MRRTAKDCARSVIHQDKVCDVDGQVVICIEWVAHSDTSVETHLFSGFNFGSRCATFAALSAEGGKLCIVCFKFFGQGVIRRNANKRRAVQCVGAGCIDFDTVVTFGRIRRCGECKLQATGFTDPVFLHQAHFGRPVV